MFLERLTAIVGPSLFLLIERTFVERPTTFRVNNLRTEELEKVKVLLEELGFKLRQAPWYHDAFVLRNKSKRELMETEEYKTGKIYIQSLASMAPPLALDPKPGERVLDLTAAPGGKTSQIAALMERTGELVANDNDEVRFFKLKHNMELLGVAQSLPLSKEEMEGVDRKMKWLFQLRMEEGSRLCGEYPEYFDKILLDAPCSAEARFVVADPKTYGYWSERKIKEMAYKQRKLLFSAWYALKPGGLLVYSTCTFAPEENEAQISRLLERFHEAEAEAIDLSGPKTIAPLAAWKGKTFHSGVQKAARILPTVEIEGFFAAKIKKARR